MDRRLGRGVRCEIDRNGSVDKSAASPRARDGGHVAAHIQNDVAGEIQFPDARWTRARSERDDAGRISVRRAGDRDGRAFSAVVEIANPLATILLKEFAGL